MSDISLNFMIVVVSIALLIGVLAVIYMISRKRSIQPLPVGEDGAGSFCYESAYRILPEAAIILNSEHRITYLNSRAEQLLGYKLRSVMGRAYQSILSLKNIKTNRVLHSEIGSTPLSEGEEIAEEYLLRTKDNNHLPVKVNLIPLGEGVGTGSEQYYLLLLKNISEKKALESKLSMLDSYDGLTGILNRKSFDSELKQLLESAYKHDSMHVVAHFSIDKYQDIYDIFGHSGSENLIREIASIIKNSIRHNLDIVARVGESEYSLIIQDNRLLLAVRTIERILKEVSDSKFTARGKEYPVSMSAGFILANKESTSSARVLSEAKKACSVASKKGGGGLSAYRADDKEMQKQEGNIEWILIIKKAIKENRFEMFAQPIHALAPLEYEKPFSHYELLLRLNDDDGNPISPDEFISAAEYYLMMPMIDRWVIRNSCNQIKQIQNQVPLPVFAINLSGQSLNDPLFHEYILDEIKLSGVDPRMLCFEITEQVAVDDISLLNKLILSLKALGSTFSLDDFGTGVSTFEYLQLLDVDYLKIDGSFVKNIANDEVALGMVQSISQIGHTMKLKIIAEYVENVEILNILSDMGVDYGQGYYIERPGPLSDVIKRHKVSERQLIE